MNKPIAMIAACLMGLNCRYDGKNKVSHTLEQLKKEYELIPVCPETLGGLSTPREKATIFNSDGSISNGAAVQDGKGLVLTESGIDVTQQFLDGATKALETYEKNHAQVAFLKSRSPSCGFGKISTPEGIKSGNGVLAEKLIRRGIRVVEVDW